MAESVAAQARAASPEHVAVPERQSEDPGATAQGFVVLPDSNLAPSVGIPGVQARIPGGAGSPEQSPRHERPAAASATGSSVTVAAGGAGASVTVAPGGAGAALVHPQKWTEEQVRAWWERRTRRRKDIGTPSKGTDGRNIMRWPISRFEQLCNGNAGIAVALYQDLRNEIERYENWKRSQTGHEGDVPLEAKAFPVPLSSPRAESTRRCRVIHSTDAPAAKPKGASPCYPNDFMAEPRSLQTKIGIGGAASPGVSPGRRAERSSGGGSLSVPMGTGGTFAQEARRATAPASRDTAPCQRVQAAKAACFKFAPAARSGEAAQPPAQRRAGRAATAVDPARSDREHRDVAPRGAQKDAAASKAGGGKLQVPVDARKARVKSAPRASRIPGPGTQGQAASPAASGSFTHPPPVAHERVSTARQRPVPSALNAAVNVPQGGPVNEQGTKIPAAKKVGRARVMEDLRDETLAQVGTPTKSASEAPAKDRLRASRDDSDLSRQPKAGTTEAAEEEDQTTRRMFDKRLLRRRHKDVFEETLIGWRAQHLHESSTSKSEPAISRVRVCVRKRPIFENELQADEFDVISVRDAEVIVHNCLTKADLRSLFVSHMGFPFSRAFGSEASDEDVYAQCAAPAVSHTLNEGVATIFMFGQTGSGKTHTMGGLVSRAIAHVFDGINSREPDEVPTVTLTSFEIAGKTIRDLLDASGQQKEVKVMEDKGHRTRVLGVCSLEARSAAELESLLQQAVDRRTTRATQVNDTSSRSHAVYRIWLGSAGAVLTLVDCAGSERREDSSHHDVQSRKDAAEINSTIFALKECFRVMRSSKGQQPPYRDSLLTRVLADSFASEQALIVAIGTVSPSASDTEHSIGTLRSLQQLQGTQMSYEAREDVAKPKSHDDAPHPRNWSEEEVRNWVEGAVGGRARTFVAGITKGTDGKNLVRWPMTRFTQLCGGDDDLGTRLYQDLRQKIRSAGA